MAEYTCFVCGKDVGMEYVKKKVRCPYCGSKIIFKNRLRPSKVLAR